MHTNTFQDNGIAITGCASKYYDGAALQCQEYWILEGNLVQVHVLNLQFKAPDTDVRKFVNYPASYEILDEYGYPEILPQEAELP